MESRTFWSIILTGQLIHPKVNKYHYGIIIKALVHYDEYKNCNIPQITFDVV